jgi:hypothetical protein
MFRASDRAVFNSAITYAIIRNSRQEKNARRLEIVCQKWHEKCHARIVRRLSSDLQRILRASCNAVRPSVVARRPSSKFARGMGWVVGGRGSLRVLPKTQTSVWAKYQNRFFAPTLSSLIFHLLYQADSNRLASIDPRGTRQACGLSSCGELFPRPLRAQFEPAHGEVLRVLSPYQIGSLTLGSSLIVRPLPNISR